MSVLFMILGLGLFGAVAFVLATRAARRRRNTPAQNATDDLAEEKRDETGTTHL